MPKMSVLSWETGGRWCWVAPLRLAVCCSMPRNLIVAARYLRAKPSVTATASRPLPWTPAEAALSTPPVWCSESLPSHAPSSSERCLRRSRYSYRQCLPNPTPPSLVSIILIPIGLAPATASNETEAFVPDFGYSLQGGAVGGGCSRLE